VTLRKYPSYSSEQIEHQVDSIDDLITLSINGQRDTEYIQQLIGRSFLIFEEMALAGKEDDFANRRMLSELNELISQVQTSADKIASGDRRLFEEVVTNFVRVIKKAERRLKVKPLEWVGPNPLPYNEEYLFKEEFE
jgi:hypothetical protein